jgi:hypothetical protein
MALGQLLRRERAPDDRLREAIQSSKPQSVGAMLGAMMASRCSGLS